jgi:hypothetical protein
VNVQNYDSYMYLKLTSKDSKPISSSWPLWLNPRDRKIPARRVTTDRMSDLWYFFLWSTQEKTSPLLKNMLIYCHVFHSSMLDPVLIQLILALPIYLMSNLELPPHLHIGLSSDLLPSVFCLKFRMEQSSNSCALPWIRRSTASFPPRRSGFDRRWSRVGFVNDKTELWQDSS